MIFREQILEGIRRGEITVAFRRWVRPAVRAGGTLRTAMGVVRFGEVRLASTVSEADARAAGYDSPAELLAELAAWPEGDLFRIEVSYAGADPRVTLRASVDLSEEEWAALTRKLARLDAASAHGAWTVAVLRLIAAQPAVRAATLARQLGRETARFKLDVRKLKELGLTESLEIGYRLSPRGQALLARAG